MTVMPDYAIHATWTSPLPANAEDSLLDLRPGTVVSHIDGRTVVAVPISARDVHEAARRLTGWTDTLAMVAGAEPFSLSIDPLEE